MDSYSFHFERMSNVDLHPLSLPVSRLSPAKSSSSIADQFAHHKHGKGDSAYSSFSGGSTAQDYPSPSLPDDLQSNSFGHYADLKYVRSIYHPAQALQTDTKTMDQLYRSVEAISQQYRNNTNIKANHVNNNSNDPVHSNNNVISKQEVPQAQATCPTILCPPPIPARMDSFIATKNLENTRVHRHSAEIQPQQPRSHSQLHSQAYSLNAPRPVRVMSDTGNLGPNSEPVYSVWRGSQQHLPQVHKQSSYHSRITSNPEYLFITDDKSVSDQRNPINISRQTPFQNTCQPQEHRRASGSGAGNGGYHNYNDSHNQSESYRKRAFSTNDWLGSENPRASSPWKTGVVNSSIQHKGQFYFVMGVCRAQSASSCVSEARSRSSPGPEKYQLREKERCHSTVENLFRPLQQSSRSSSGTIQDEVFTSVSHDQDSSAWNQDQENRRLSSNSIQSAQSFDNLEEMNEQNREIGRHTSSNPIFYCGPDRSYQPQSTSQAAELTPHTSSEQIYDSKKADQVKKGTRQPLGDIGSERINKETTPLLYHLTEGSRAALQPRKKPNFSIKGKEPNLNKSTHDITGNSDSPPKAGVDKINSGEISACNTLDDSYKKYYMEKIKDAQSKVLRATSFKRKDLQLSWPHRIRQKPEITPQVIHTFSPSQDSETSTETLTPSLASQETETGSVKEDVKEGEEMDKEPEVANWCAVNVAQPQAIRMRGKKRLTPEQKKMCYSEPEKLHQLGSAPFHSSCRSFGNESEDLFAVEGEDQQCEQQGEPGLVAARRKMFETKDQAFSIPTAPKSNQKQLRQKALVEYMERKTGHKVPEPQQPGPLVPPSSRHRHSLGEKPFDWGPRLQSGNHDGKTSKKKLHRPHSAGRILDSSTSSARYAQFFSAQSCSGQYALQANQPRWSKGPSQGKYASVESLLDQIEPSSFLRSRSASTPHTLEDVQGSDRDEDTRPVQLVEPTSTQKISTEDSLKKAVAEGQQRLRAAAQRGKSMEELGTGKMTGLPAISKSSEQLDQLRSLNGAAGFNRETKNMAVSAEDRRAQGQERDAPEHVTEQSAEEPEAAPITQGQTPNQTQRKSPTKHNAEPEDDPFVATRTSSRSTSPTSPSSCRIRVLSGSHGPVSDASKSSRPPSESMSTPPSPRALESSECESKSTPPSPTQTNPPCESRSHSRAKMSPLGGGSEREQALHDGEDSNQEVALSCGVTTDPSLWSVLPEEPSQMTDSVFEDDPTPAAPGALVRTASASPSASVSDRDVGEQAEDETTTETADEESKEEEERGTPEGETEGAQKPMDRPQWEELVQAVVAADPSLSRAMYPLSNRKTALMLMEQLLSEDTLLMEEHYKKKQELQGATESAENVKVSESAPLPPAAAEATPECPNPQSEADVAEKKRLLVSHIEGHLRSLEERRGPLQAEMELNAAHGAALELLVRDHCLPVEVERYSLFIGDLERVVNLLLCLSARLARVQNALSTVDQHTDAEEKQSLDSRHRLLCKQREDAKDLKVNLDRRENMVSTFLSRQLSAEQLQDYRRFVQTKASLLIRLKDLEERQRLAEEQLEALSSSLNL